MPKLTLLFLSLFFSAFVYAETISTNNTPIGYWKTIDDVSGKPQSVIKIWEDDEHRLEGTIVKVFLENCHDKNKLCVACKDEKHNQPILGMTILTNLKRDDGQWWTNGKILDPSSGKIYKCKMQTIAEGTKLNVRGYIGVPILGRTQTWLRVNAV